MSFHLYGSQSHHQQQKQQFHDRNQPVYLNFHETVPVGESSFAVSVPRSWSTIQLPNGETLRRRFKFTELNITPGFYSQRASVLGVDADSIVRSVEGSDDLSLRFAVGYTCLDSLYHAEKADGSFAESPYEQGNLPLTLQEFVNALNAKFQTLVPTGFASSPVFFDWVDLKWYEVADGEPERHQQVAHDSEDQTVPLSVDPSSMVSFLREEYYGINEEDGDLAPFENGLPASVRKMTGVNDYVLPTSVVRELRIRIHVAPNTKVSFSASSQLEGLGFTQAQAGGRGTKQRFHLANPWIGGNAYAIFTAEKSPQPNIPKAPARVFCTNTRDTHTFKDETVTFTTGSFAENWQVLGLFQSALNQSLVKTGLTFPQLRYNPELIKFRFEHPDNDRLSLFVQCDPRLSERLGFGPVAKVTRNMVPSVMRDGTSKIEAETLAKALVFDAGMCLVTLDQTYSNDTYGLDDFSMTTLWPTDSGTFHMSDKFSRSAFLPSVVSSNAQNLTELAFTVSTLKQKSVRAPLSWPVNFCAEGTLEGNV